MGRFVLEEGQGQVKCLFVTPGNSGCNQATFFMGDTSMEEAPGVNFLVLDVDGALLADRFSGGGVDEQSRRLNAWLDSNRCQVIQLKKDAKGANGRQRRVFGAGGDPEVGRKIIKPHLASIEKAMQDVDIVVIWAAGGGGIGTAAMEATAKIAKKKVIPFISMLYIPFAHEGGKVPIANRLRHTLRRLGPTLVMRNEALPMEKRNADLYDVYHGVHEECGSGVFEAWLAITTEVGIQNLDLEDVIKASQYGSDAYIGRYDPSQDGAENVEEVIHQLTNHSYQQTNMVARSLLFGFSGWTVDETQKIIGGVQKAMTFPTNGYVKQQTSRSSNGKKRAFVMAFGTFGKVAVVKSQKAKGSLKALALITSEPKKEEESATTEEEESATAGQSNVAAQVEVPAPAVSRDKELAGKYGTDRKRFGHHVNGRFMPLYVPEVLGKLWQQELNNPPNMEGFKLFEELREDYGHYGSKPDVPSDWREAKSKPLAEALEERAREQEVERRRAAAVGGDKKRNIWNSVRNRFSRA